MIDFQFLLLLKAITDAQIQVAAMQAENEQRKHLGQAMAYTEQDFFNVGNCLDQIWQVNRP